MFGRVDNYKSPKVLFLLIVPKSITYSNRKLINIIFSREVNLLITFKSMEIVQGFLPNMMHIKIKLDLRVRKIHFDLKKVKFQISRFKLGKLFELLDQLK